MIKSILTHLPITSLIIIYLFISGGVYLVGFWGTFNVEAFSLIEIWDIPKNFIAPFLYSGGAFLLFVTAYWLYINSRKENIFIKTNPSSDMPKKKSNYKIYLILIVMILFLIFYNSLRFNYYFWTLSFFTLAGVLILEIKDASLAVKIIPNNLLRFYVFILIILPPVMCFVVGKGNALLIYNNSKVQIVKIATNSKSNNISDTTSLKLLGFLGEKFIVSSLDNKKIFVLNQSSFDVIELDKK